MSEDFLMSITRTEIFRLGQAHGSFSLGSLDQGVDIVLPVTNGNGIRENEIFRPLFNDYLNRIQEELPPVICNEVYMGAIEKFARDRGLDIGNTYHIEVFERNIS